jgi:hypothetical protein
MIHVIAERLFAYETDVAKFSHMSVLLLLLGTPTPHLFVFRALRNEVPKVFTGLLKIIRPRCRHISLVERVRRLIFDRTNAYLGGDVHWRSTTRSQLAFENCESFISL